MKIEYQENSIRFTEGNYWFMYSFDDIFSGEREIDNNILPAEFDFNDEGGWGFEGYEYMDFEDLQNLQSSIQSVLDHRINIMDYEGGDCDEYIIHPIWRYRVKRKQDLYEIVLDKATEVGAVQLKGRVTELDLIQWRDAVGDIVSRVEKLKI